MRLQLHVNNRRVDIINEGYDVALRVRSRLDDDGTLYLMDEVLTPDSSRFWPADGYRVGISPPSFDKQFVRDWLETQTWDKTPPAPRLPQDVLEKTAAKYREALDRLIA